MYKCNHVSDIYVQDIFIYEHKYRAPAATVIALKYNCVTVIADIRKENLNVI